MALMRRSAQHVLTTVTLKRKKYECIYLGGFRIPNLHSNRHIHNSCELNKYLGNFYQVSHRPAVWRLS